MPEASCSEEPGAGKLHAGICEGGAGQPASLPRHWAAAQYNLGACYRDARGVAKDYVEAVKWFRMAAEQNHADAKYNLGVAHGNGHGVAKDEGAAVKWYRRAAEQNLAQAQNELGLCYCAGQGVEKDFAEATKCYRKAADQGYANAQHNLGVCYERGEGVLQDHAEAAKWYLKAAEQNYAIAQVNLGLCFCNGQGVLKDGVQGYKWWLLGSAQGIEVAKKNMTILEGKLTREQIAQGQELASDFKVPVVATLDAQPSEAERQLRTDLRIKAEAGDAQAQNEMGEALYAGKRGVEKDAVAAVKWLRQAADQNDPTAQSNLGICYECGEGVAKYEVEAYKWDLLAAAQGDAKAKRNVTMLELLLSPEQIAEGKRRAKDWLD